MLKPFSWIGSLALLVFGLIAAFGSADDQGLRFVMGLAFSSPAISWSLAALGIILAVGMWWELWRARAEEAEYVAPQRRVDAQPRSGSAPMRGDNSPAKRPAAVAAKQTAGLESVMVDGKLTPAAYFMFASKTLPVAAIRKAKEKYGRVLVGFDAGGIPMNGEIDNDSFAVARDLGAELEIYVEGPGGKTGDSWDPGEEARVKAAAKSVGIDVREKGWRTKHWDTQGWKDFTFRQLAYYRGIGFNAGEIDNLDRAIKGPEQLVAFYREYGERQLAGELPQLVMKNISVEDMTAVVEAMKTSVLPRRMFADFHIFECGNTNEWHPVDEISAAQGIRTVPSRDTYNYDAKGVFGLNAEFDTTIAQNATQPSTPTS
jgi:hypothetical protein